MSKYIDAEKLKAEIERQKKIDGWCEVGKDTADVYYARGFRFACDNLFSIIDSLQQEQPEVDLENYISNKLRELGADLINHKPYSFNRGLNVGETNAYHDILDRLNARKDN